MKKLFLTLGFMMIALPAMASEIVTIQVKGMVCDFCAQSITKVFEKNEAVQDVKVDLDTQTVTVITDTEGAVSDEEAEEAIYYAGYDFVSLERTSDE